MQVCAAGLSLLLAAPGLAAPPATTTEAGEALQSRIFTVIKESDPEEMQPPRTPRPLSELVAAAELAASELRNAPPEDVYELLSLLHDARMLAYQRSSADAAHLCAELRALSVLMRRGDLDKNSADRVTRLAATGRSALAARHPGRVCEDLPVAETEVSSALMPVPSSASFTPTSRPRPAPFVDPGQPGNTTRTKISPTTLAGGVLLAVAGGLVVAVAPVQASRVRLRDEADALRDKVMAAGETTSEDAARSARLRRAADRTHLATTSLLTSAAAVAILGAVLVAVGVRRQSRRLEVVPQAGTQGPGILVQGRF